MNRSSNYLFAILLAGIGVSIFALHHAPKRESGEAVWQPAAYSHRLLQNDAQALPAADAVNQPVAAAPTTANLNPDVQISREMDPSVNPYAWALHEPGRG